MKFGLMTQIQVPRPWGPGAERDAFHNAVAQAAAGEAHGFEYFWITEQHFYYEIGHCSAPEMVLAAIDRKAWRAKPPGRGTRTIATIFTHVHNIRRKWVRLSAPGWKLPKELRHRSCTLAQARKSLAESGRLCGKLLGEALEGRIEKFHRDGWARLWPAGAVMFAYMMAHEAHHRGQLYLMLGLRGVPTPPLYGLTEEELRRRTIDAGR